ncbi:dihydroorotate dehydrogenase [Salsipaludibacter albus]|uniref:dihydroorotate dehydrogenase n=1 Tax=Salsipaludibacter albus TaxID=2849650 RepID=UPI001EE47702|nr:dihydroorotate dehydrogenase [Salsipaludibacter albus]MBY5164033.1 dihydroorotate dehydrogenase [Salsipaludibacter albus]
MSTTTRPTGRTTGVDLSVDLGGLVLPNPIMTASGCFASGREIDALWNVSELGAVVAKSVTLEPREGLPTPRMSETPSGMLNAIGLQNPGVDAWLERDVPWLASRGARVVASIAGNSVDDYREVARRVAASRSVAAVEVNLSCPNVSHRGLVFACDPGRSAEVVRAVRQALPDRPLFAKLTPDVTDIARIGRSVVEAGATGISAINTTLGMAIDAETGRPKVANGFAGLSGPAIRPMAVRAVHQLFTELGPEVPIIGMGGVRTVTDVVEMVRAGASAVAIGTATFADPFTAANLVRDLGPWLGRRGHTALADLRGRIEPWPHHPR